MAAKRSFAALLFYAEERRGRRGKARKGEGGGGKARGEGRGG